MTTPRPRYSAQEVAKAFVMKYYVILHKSPEVAHKFYQESSLLGWPRLYGVRKTVTTLSGIHGEIMSSDYKYCPFETETVEVQESLDGGILIVVAGLLALKDGVIKGFSQTFFLATQEDGFFVLNDILQVGDLSRFSTNAAIQDNQKKDQVAPAQNSGLVVSVPCSKTDHPASSQTKEVVEKGNAKKAAESSVSKDPDANVAATTSSEVASSQTNEAVVHGNAEKTTESSVSKDPDANVAATTSSEVASSQTNEAVVHGNAEKTAESSVSKDPDANVAATTSSEVASSQTNEAVVHGNAEKTTESSVSKDPDANVAAATTSEVASSQTNEAVVHGNAEKTAESSVSKDPDANFAATTSSEVAFSQIKEAVEDGNAKKTSDSSVSKDTDAKVAATNSSEVEASSEKACPILSPASDVKKEASPKITYASMVAKATPTSSPIITSIHSKFDKKAVARLTFKSSASFVQGASKVSNPRSTGSNPSAHSNAAEPEMQPVKRIYIGGLPYDITKQSLLEVLKQFGPVRRNSDSIQIRRLEDGFCCGFVEFESVDSARRAIEARYVKFGRKESYMAYRRSTSDRGKRTSYARESR